MKLDELEDFYEELPINPENMKHFVIKPSFIFRMNMDIPKLLAIARAAQQQWAPTTALKKALAELEKE